MKTCTLPAYDEFWDLFDRVKMHMNWDSKKTIFWFNTVNPLLGECAPVVFFMKRKDKCIAWIDAMISENSVDH